MKIDAVSIKGQLRMKIPIHLDGKVWTVDEFLDRFHNYNILRGLPPIYAAGNMELTLGGVMYYSSMELHLRRNRRGWIILDRIVSPDRGDIEYSFTHPHDLRHGKISYFNPYPDHQWSNPYTAGKRLKLSTGYRIKGDCPLPHEVGIPSGREYPDGIILVSPKYASQFRLHTSSNIYHKVDIDHLGMLLEDLDLPILSTLTTTHGSTPLMTGDKLAGVVGQYLVKGTVIIDPTQSIDMILPKDSIKATGMKCTEFNRMYVRLRATDRVSTYDTRLSYQVGQFIPHIVSYRISTLLNVPLGVRDPAVQSTIYKDSRACARVASTVPTEEDLLSMLDLCTNLSKRIWDDITKATCITLFQWKEHDSSGTEVFKSIHWAEDISLGMNPYKNRNLMRAIKREVMIKLSKMISPPVRGAWGVATPIIQDLDQPVSNHIRISTYSGMKPLEGTSTSIRHKGEIDKITAKDLDIISSISVPKRVYYHLGSPKIVAALRSPIKGRSSLIRMYCISHEDSDSTFRIHPTIMRDIFAGDHDGDILQVISNPDIVEAACDIPTSMSRCTRVHKAVPHIEVEYPQCTDISKAQSIVAGWRGDVGVACNIRDNLYGSGLLTEDQSLLLFEALFQPALAQMDGSPPVARYLLENPGILADIIGIDVSNLLNTDGTIMRSPSSTLAAIRGSLTYNDFITAVNEADSSTPHGILLCPFKILPSIH